MMRNDQRKEIQDLVEILQRHNLTEIEMERKDFRIRIRRDLASGLAHPASLSPPSPQSVSAQPAPEPSDLDTSRFFTVTSPIVGTFYRSPSPDADPYVEENDMVTKGQVLCIVEAMKLMNEIESEVDGRIVKILVDSASPVEYGQPLFLIDPTPAP